MNRAWTTKELDYLEEHWASKTKQNISKELNRSEVAIYKKALKLELGAEFQNHLTFKDIAKLTGVDSHTVANSWVNKGLKYKKQGRFHYVSIAGLEKFLKENQKLWNSEHLEEFILGKEPSWLKEKRKVDAELKIKNRYRKWTKEEDKKLIRLSRTHTQPQIGKIMDRSQLSVRARVRKLREKKIIKPSGYVPWKKIEDKMLIEMDIQGKLDKEIAHELGREISNIGNRRSLLKKNKQYPCGHKRDMRLMQKEVANG